MKKLSLVTWIILPATLLGYSPRDAIVNSYLSQYGSNKLSNSQKITETLEWNDPKGFKSSLTTYNSRALLFEFIEPALTSDNSVHTGSNIWEEFGAFDRRLSKNLAQVINPKTLAGEVYAAAALTYFLTNDVDTLRKRQDAILALTRNPNTLGKIQKALNSYAASEVLILDFFDRRHPLNGPEVQNNFVIPEDNPLIGEAQAHLNNRNWLAQFFNRIFSRNLGILMAMGVKYRSLKSAIPDFFGGNLWTAAYIAFDGYILFRLFQAPYEIHKHESKLNPYISTELITMGKWMKAVLDLSEVDGIPSSLQISFSEDARKTIQNFVGAVEELDAGDTHLYHLNLSKAMAAFRHIMELREMIVKIIPIVAELDYYSSLSNLYLNSAGRFNLVSFQDSCAFIEAKNLHNPMLKPNTSIANDICLGRDCVNNWLLTGDNMSGKSTLMRTLGLNILLAQTTGFSFGIMNMTSFSAVNGYMNKSDHVGTLSSFETEVADNKALLEFYEGLKIRDRALMLSDELFSSTNPEDALIGSQKVMAELFKHPNALSIISTHLTELTDGLDEDAAANKHMKNYVVQDGAAKGSNALGILEERLGKTTSLPKVRLANPTSSTCALGSASGNS